MLTRVAFRLALIFSALLLFGQSSIAASLSVVRQCMAIESVKPDDDRRGLSALDFCAWLQSHPFARAHWEEENDLIADPVVPIQEQPLSETPSTLNYGGRGRALGLMEACVESESHLANSTRGGASAIEFCAAAAVLEVTGN